ncbi:MAG: hypothetical protein IKE06_05430 [Solobacterium sp.]|nr:hypothetical protein [Solobacterium sp.]MBR3127638.1 hypothetical protein [Solobacterium sp.]
MKNMNADFYSLIYLVLDAVILVWIGRMILNTRTIVLKTKTGFRWLVPLLFFTVAVISYLRNLPGIFRVIQPVLLMIMGCMYWFVGSGLSEDGIVVMGQLTRYDHAENLAYDDEDGILTFSTGRKSHALFFAIGQDDDVLKFLRERKLIRTKKKK